jgi:putative ABC transport system permease protein
MNGFQLGQTISLGQKAFEIVGIVDLKPENTVLKANVYMSIEDARYLSGLPAGSANMFFARLKKGLDPEIVRTRLTAILPGILLTTTDNIGQIMKGFGRISGVFSKGLCALALLFAAIVCHRLLVGSVYERQRDIGIMKTVGWRSRDISRAFSTEAFLLSAVGGLAGVVLGYGIAYLLGSFEITLKIPWNLNPMPVTAAKTDLIQMKLPVVFSIKTAVWALAVSSIFGVAAGKMVSRKLSAIKPMDAIRDI